MEKDPKEFLKMIIDIAQEGLQSDDPRQFIAKIKMETSIKFNAIEMQRADESTRAIIKRITSTRSEVA